MHARTCMRVCVYVFKRARVLLFFFKYSFVCVCMNVLFVCVYVRIGSRGRNMPQTDCEQIWPSGPNEKNQIEKSEDNKPKITKIVIDKMGHREIAAV